MSFLSSLAQHRFTHTEEVATYSDYFGGNAYGYIVEQDGEEGDACWGFIGDYDGFCLEEARRCVV